MMHLRSMATLETFKYKDTFEKVADDFLDFVKNKKIIIHNASFDLGFLNGNLIFKKRINRKI